MPAPNGADLPRDDRTELALLDAWRHGDASAMGTLLRGYQNRIYAVCFRMLRSADEASDLTQEALVRVLEGLHTYDGRSQLSTWVIRVTMNCCLSHLRKQKLRRHASLDDFGQRSGSWASMGANLESDSDTEPGGVRGVERHERRIAVVRALARLDPDTRAILVLRDSQGLEYQQIGEVLSVPVGTVKSRLFRARAALRELTEHELGIEPREESEPPQRRENVARSEPPTANQPLSHPAGQHAGDPGLRPAEHPAPPRQKGSPGTDPSLRLRPAAVNKPATQPKRDVRGD